MKVPVVTQLVFTRQKKHSRVNSNVLVEFDKDRSIGPLSFCFVCAHLTKCHIANAFFVFLQFEQLTNAGRIHRMSAGDAAANRQGLRHQEHVLNRASQRDQTFMHRHLRLRRSVADHGQHQARCTKCFVIGCLQFGCAGIGIACLQRLHKRATQSFTLLGGYHDEAPRLNASVVRRLSGCFEDEF